MSPGQAAYEAGGTPVRWEALPEDDAAVWHAIARAAIDAALRSTDRAPLWAERPGAALIATAPWQTAPDVPAHVLVVLDGTVRTLAGHHSTPEQRATRREHALTYALLELALEEIRTATITDPTDPVCERTTR